MKLAKAAFAATLVSASLIGGMSSLAAQDMSNPSRRPTLTITGEGRATAVPDMARFSTGVVSEGKTAREALDANSKAVAEMIAALKEAGLEPRDIATSGFSVQPQYAPPKKDSTEPPRVTGYQVQNTVSVRLRDLARLGDLLDKMVTSGANQIGGIAFEIADPSKLEDKARVAAVEDARHQAELIAQASGVRLVRVLTVTGNGGVRPMARAMAAPMMMKADSVPVEAGEAEIQASVTVSYEIEAR
ncbi:SIMPL domain-containing protein [Ancylobacter oerskovii]|uniref:SIMPL domain-containing protein n=1 Tax=Ancylobacter oerskovii TaxID=459519 RepID=A0ABW4YY40_9HYPH|nr:SIMPL domain-containing protein [Ancylobacter oerskovii]MBS7541778.1 SIMPL domain-containing protein [Ancylobacter oerskovii]